MIFFLLLSIRLLDKGRTVAGGDLVARALAYGVRAERVDGMDVEAVEAAARGALESVREGRGPAWSNSLFEDNAEFGLGFRLAVDQQIKYAHELLRRLSSQLGDELVGALINNQQAAEEEIVAQLARVAELNKRARATKKDQKRGDALRVRKNYFAQHRERMHYPQYEALGLPIAFVCIFIALRGQRSAAGGQDARGTAIGHGIRAAIGAVLVHVLVQGLAHDAFGVALAAF